MIRFKNVSPSRRKRLLCIFSKLYSLFLLFSLFPINLASNCTKEQFACRTGAQCIAIQKWQDGIDDCWDTSDEECLPWQFDCKFGAPRCVSKKSVRDGNIDCFSGSDEGCPSHFFVCRDRSACIEPSKFQDGRIDCLDKSDEPCAQGYFPCNDGSKCIEQSKFQNGILDCSDGSDEECTTSQLTCECGRVRCVHNKHIGDGTWDCEDGSDELLNSEKPTTASAFCPNGDQRRNGGNTLLMGEIQLCEGKNECLSDLGQICIVVGGASRCVCKMGTVRPLGSTKCIPLELMNKYFENPLANCSENRLNLKRQFDIQLTSVTKEFPEIRRAPPIKVQKTTQTIDSASALYFEAGNVTVPYMFISDDELISDDECDPKNDFSCSGNHTACLVNPDGVYRCGCEAGSSLVNGACIGLINECLNKTLNDCNESAICIDSTLSYECLCKEGYLDVSNDPVKNPGRKCLRLINECADASLNDCHPNAKCIDRPSGYTCRCNSEFVDVDISTEGSRKPGRNCTARVNECKKGLHDCDPAAICYDDSVGYRCRCPLGYLDGSPVPEKRGRLCIQMSVDCKNCNLETSQCISTNTGNVACICKDDYVDLNPINPGINCTKKTGSNPCQDYSLHDCDAVAECVSEQPGYFQCHCPKGFLDISTDKRFPGRKCIRVVNECALGTHTCDPNAACVDTQEGYTCKCNSGWLDASRDSLRSPGRICKRANMCHNVDCAAEAECRETPIGPVCQCVSGYVDISRQHGLPAGRVCRAVINECALGKHDCSRHASCIDTADSYTCRCHDNYRDESPDSSRNPGRVCVRAMIPDPPECDVSDPMSCDQSKSEVCIFVNNTYKCRCANGYSRLPDGRCLAIDECKSKNLNTCGENSECLDLAEGYTCQCRSGYADISPSGQPGRICKARVNECSHRAKYGVDCHENAICTDTEDSYTCQCRPGFADISASYNRLPGRNCIEAINECANSQLNDCSKNAFCEDAKEGYICSCRPGYLDTSPNATHYPGRVCTKPIEKLDHELSNSLQLDGCDPKHPACDTNEVCTDKGQRGQHTCQCSENSFRFTDGKCKLYSACSRQNECDTNAVCLNLFNTYKCQCRPGYIDVSADPDINPGRKCRELVNECATADNGCSPFARCIDATNGYACQCLDGYVDVSSSHGLRPGRKCASASNECAADTLNTCDENADCIDLPDGYACQCYAGFVDVSSSANLPPGRVCTVQTTCPKQKTDLMFLIDGSGSIGSYVFKHEVLRFIREFVELFEIGPDQTRVGLIQYSDQIRHEFDLGQYADKVSVLRAITETKYLTGLTRTGAAIQHMVQEGFSERRGARPERPDISRVAIILTDGRSQDNVSGPAESARKLHINTFSIGVTDHVLASELETIAGSPNRWFYVDKFKDLDTRLRSMIQKAACPSPIRMESHPTGTCNPRTQTGCDRTLNELCVEEGGRTHCVCPDSFQRHPISRVCGGSLCNPQLTTSCIFPEECQITPYNNFRCACPEGYSRDYKSGFCVSIKEVHIAPQHDGDCHNGGIRCSPNEQCIRDLSGRYSCECQTGFERNRQTGQCSYPGSCVPSQPFSCDARKREKCLPHNGFYTCQCDRNEKRHPITGICLKNECLTNENDCDRSAICTDTDDGYLCSCRSGFFDQSPDPVHKPGRLCVAEQNECLDGSHKCSPNALCTDTQTGYVCRCKPGYVDYSPNPQSFPGMVCQELVNECASPRLNNCDRNAMCIDTVEAYTCVCRSGFTDMDEFRNPGRNCKKIKTNERCTIGNNDCDRNARCIQIGDDDYSCACPPGFKDKSPSLSRPGRVCIPVIPECDNPSLNDCDSPDRAICTDTDDGYMCRCRQGFLDISPSPSAKPGRLCKPLQNECALGTHDCARDGGICEDTPDSFNCRCAMSYLDVSYDRQNRPGRKCKRLIDECATGQNDCSREAICTDTEDSYTCSCPRDYIDLSTDPVRRPGRRCLQRIDECATNRDDCSPNADCMDTPESYKCRCRDDFVDESPDPIRRAGRICRPALVDECRLRRHDCHQDADCQDLPHGYTCQCRSNFLDESPNRSSHPGRLCVPRPTPPPPECRVDGPNQCKAHLNEVCRLMAGEPKCTCPFNYQRDGSGVCSVINECEFPHLNDCHTAADCIDQMQGYTCRCKQDYKDVGSSQKPGRMCKPMVNECQFPHLNDCHQHAQCIDLEEGYECKCHQGFMDRSRGRPGRICQQLVNECSQPSLNSCDRNARCIDEEEGYRCECKAGFIDVSPSSDLSGRSCKQLVNECADQRLNDCDRNARCRDTTDSYECQCPTNSKDISPNHSFPGRVCLIFENECETGKNDCDPNALCHDNEQSYSCECPAGSLDRSPDRMRRPGRVCIKLVDECKTGRHTCSAQADCRDLEEGYTCECRDGYIDRSPNMATQPGRVCGVPEVCPPDHQCSSAAVCEPLGGNNYRCSCIQGYIDQSPGNEKGRVCVRNNACRDPKLNTCSRNAICYDEPRGYRCECARGYIDRSPDASSKGRVCEPPPPPTPPPRHPCQDPSRNDCHSAGVCRATGAQTYTCECLPGYADRSPDTRSKPGRICELTQPVCLDPTQNDCHSAAICLETQTSEKYTCKCRDGYMDQSPDPNRRPGRICAEMVNECLVRSMNDCHPLAMCEDRPKGYTCRCPMSTIDRSPDHSRPGRLCVQNVNECANPSLNHCSRFADCIDKENGYECRCRSGYHDDSPSNPGTQCTFVINECESSNLNDCDAHAQCIDLPGGYDCRCKSPYRDEGPPGHPGRICRLNECLSPNLNTCDRNADCMDVEDGYICSCKTGFYDQSPNQREPGRICVEFQVEQHEERITIQRPHNTPPPQQHDGLQCGRAYCDTLRGEVCISGSYCGCRPGESRSSGTGRCQPVEETTMQIRVISRDSRPLLYSSEFGSPASPPYVEVVDKFQKDIARTFGSTSYAPRYVATKVKYITHPKTVNSSWPDGLLFKYDVQTTKTLNNAPVDQCDLWKQMMGSLQRTNLAIGGGSLRVADDTDNLNPCKEPEPIGECGGLSCKSNLGEVCIAGSVCGCPTGMKRASSSDICRAVESWNVPLWVMRKEKTNLVYNDTFSNPLDTTYKNYVHDLEDGIGGCYPHTTLKNSFVSAEVNDITNPSQNNASWTSGLLFNTTVHFRKGAVRIPSDTYYQLVRYIVDRNGYEVGDSGLYLNEYQPDPYKACYQNDCHAHARCVDTGPKSYRCECGPGFRDLSPSDPGKKCLPTNGFNECERKEDNECSENARCIDLDHLYKCECLPSYTDASPMGSVPGSLCTLDYCSDVNFCPTNTTCKNMEQQAECACDLGFMDIRKSEKRTMLGMSDDTLCLHVRDVDECALGLTNCSGVAQCIDRAIGYTCKCPDGYIDGNPDDPGRVCGALLCDLCNSHGDCVHNAETKNITCVCTDGWSGEFCAVAPSNASLILLILLALLFLLLALCCLLYLCTKCHCFKARGAGAGAFGYRRGGAWPWSTLEGSSSSESGAEFSGMSAGHEYYPDIGIPRAKLKQGEAAAMASNTQQSMDVARLNSYLDEGIENMTKYSDIAKMNNKKRSEQFSEAIEEESYTNVRENFNESNSSAELMLDIAKAGAVRIPRAHLGNGGVHDSYDSMSNASSEYTIKEEIERKVITDVTTKEITTTTTTDASGNTVTTTSEFTVHPPEHTMQHLALMGKDSSMNEESSYAMDSARESSFTHGSDFSSKAANQKNLSSIKEVSGFHDDHRERERGESVAEFSIGRASGNQFSSSGHKEMEEYVSESEEEEIVTSSRVVSSSATRTH